MSELFVGSLLDLSKTTALDLFQSVTYPWEVLPRISDWIKSAGPALSGDEYEEIAPEVWVHKTAEIAPSASITGPCIIGAGTEIRHCAFIRGNALVGVGAVVGNSTELKNVILFDCVQVPHYNYVGDSILGFKSHLGAGAITSNVKSDKSDICVNGAEKISTGLRKFGAILGDFVEVGCGSILNPGTIIGRNSNIYPLSPVRGIVPADSIFKHAGNVVPKHLSNS